MDVLPQLITSVSFWPSTLALTVQSINPPLSYNEKTGNKEITIRVEEDHFNFIDRNGKTVRVAPDGNCFFASLLKGFEEYADSRKGGISPKMYLLTAPIDKALRIQLLRNMISVEMRAPSDLNQKIMECISSGFFIDE